MNGGTLLNKKSRYSVSPDLSNSTSESLKRYYAENPQKGSWNKGKSWSEESRKRMSESRKKYFEDGGKSTNGLDYKWVTPYATFSSYMDKRIYDFGLTPRMVQKRCSDRCDLAITKTAAHAIKDFDAFPHIGKTWRELGWYKINLQKVA